MTRPVDELLGDRRWLVLTGAGISTDSGIPDYRGPDSVPRTPMTLQELRSGPEAQQRYWARAALGWRTFAGVSPNAGHRALAALEAAGRVTGVITQNVDGLHTAAGSRRVVDLHGRLSQVVCLACGTLRGRDEVQAQIEQLNPGYAERSEAGPRERSEWGYDARPVRHLPDGDVDLADTTWFVTPTCDCGGALKPDVVFFGENVPVQRVADCADLVEEAEALVVLGSSLHVFSGRRWVKAAHQRGIPIVIVNRGETRGDALASLKVEAGCAETLAAWVQDFGRSPWNASRLRVDSPLASRHSHSLRMELANPSSRMTLNDSSA